MEHIKRGRGAHSDYKSPEASTEERIERLRDILGLRNDQEIELLQELSSIGPFDQRALQDLWLGLLGTTQKIDGEMKLLIKERLKR